MVFISAWLFNRSDCASTCYILLALTLGAVIGIACFKSECCQALSVCATGQFIPSQMGAQLFYSTMCATLWTFRYRHYASFQPRLLFIFLEERPSSLMLSKAQKQGSRFLANALSLYGPDCLSHWKSYNQKQQSYKRLDYDAGRSCRMCFIGVALECRDSIKHCH